MFCAIRNSSLVLSHSSLYFVLGGMEVKEIKRKRTKRQKLQIDSVFYASFAGNVYLRVKGRRYGTVGFYKDVFVGEHSYGCK